MSPGVQDQPEQYSEMSQNFNFNIRGGSKKIDYFSSASVNHDSGVLRSNKDFSYNNNINIMRYVFQNNINAYLSKTSTLSLRLNVQLRDYNGPHSDASDVYGMVMEANPVDFPVRWPRSSEYDYIMWGGKSVVLLTMDTGILMQKWQEVISLNFQARL